MHNQLVTVCVITYNSKSFVEATLDSIKAQTYKNLEIIVSDDCSTDGTVDFVKSWIAKNAERFINCALLTAEKNTGPAGNCNRAVGASHGEWIKIIAGDDILMENCIEKNLDFVFENPEAEIVFSKLQPFEDTADGRKILDSSHMETLSDKFNRSTQEQYDLLLKEMFCPSPSSFIKRSIFDKFHYLEDYPFIEDLPFYHTLLKNGIHLYFLNVYTVYYRCQESIQRSKVRFYNEGYENSRFAFYFKERRELILAKDPERVLKRDRSYIVYQLMILLNRNKINLFNKCLMFLLTKIIGIIFLVKK